MNCNDTLEDVENIASNQFHRFSETQNVKKLFESLRNIFARETGMSSLSRSLVFYLVIVSRITARCSRNKDVIFQPSRQIKIVPAEFPTPAILRGNARWRLNLNWITIVTIFRNLDLIFHGTRSIQSNLRRQRVRVHLGLGLEIQYGLSIDQTFSQRGGHFGETSLRDPTREIIKYRAWDSKNRMRLTYIWNDALNG